MSGYGKVVESLSLRILKSIHAAIQPLKLKSNDAVHECCGLLDDQEGRAFLAADLVGVELVRGMRANESRKVGEQIDELLRGERARDQLIRKGIRSRKAKVRGKEGAESKLQALDVEQRRKRAEHWDAELTLPLPDPATTKVKKEREHPPPPPKLPPPPAPQTAAQRRTKVEKAEEAAARADADEVAARRRYEKAEAAQKKISDRRLENSSGGWLLEDEAYEQLLAARVVDDREHEQASARSILLFGEWIAARDAAAEARFAADEARRDATPAASWEASWAALEAKWKRRDEQRTAEWAAMEAARVAEREAEEARARLEALEDQRWLEARRAELEREHERESREFEREIARSQWAYSRPEVVRAHAEKIWGAASQKGSSSPPKVFCLVGKSADEVRSLACDVSQVETGTEERVRLNRMQHEMLY